MLRKVTVKIELQRIDTQEGVTVEVLLDSSVIELVISLEFTKKQEFKLKKQKDQYITLKVLFEPTVIFFRLINNDKQDFTKLDQYWESSQLY